MCRLQKITIGSPPAGSENAPLLCLWNLRPLPAELKRGWPLFTFALFPCAMYIVVHEEVCFLAPCFVLLWIGLFAALARASEDLPPE